MPNILKNKKYTQKQKGPARFRTGPRFVVFIPAMTADFGGAA